MSIPKLKKIKSEKKYHDLTLSDEYAWVDQPNILEVLKDASKLDSEVKDFISGNNKITEDYFKDVKDLQDNLFQEIKSKIKLDDTSLKFKDKKYFYWAKTEAKGNYGKRIRQLIDGSKPEEVYFDGDLEKKNYGSEYFGVGSVSTSHCDNYMAYSLDLKGSEYYTIYLRDLRTGKNENDIIDNTSGGITWSLDNRSFFYSRLDKFLFFNISLLAFNIFIIVYAYSLNFFPKKWRKKVNQDTLVGLALIFVTMFTMFAWIIYYYLKIF